MDILYSIISFKTGGAETLLVNILNNWSNNQDRLVLCVINDFYDEEMLNKINSNVKVICLNRKKGQGNIQFLRKYLNLIKKNNISIIHSQDKESMVLSVIAKLFFKDIKIFHTVHDMKIYNQLSNKYVFLDKLFTEKIIAISECVKNEIVSRGIKENKIKVIYNGIDFSIYKKERKEREDKSIHIGCLGRIQPYKKGQDILIKAIAEVKKTYPSVKCFFAGTYMEGEKYCMDELYCLTESKNLKDNIIFLGMMRNVPEFLQNMDMLIVPSRYEGFGLVLIEGMAANIPVLASNIDGPREIIKDNMYGDLFETENYYDLCNKIVKKIKDIEDKNDEKVNRAYTYAKENFDIKQMTSKLRDTYNSINLNMI